MFNTNLQAKEPEFTPLVQDHSLAKNVQAEQFEWLTLLNPVTDYFCGQLSKGNFAGKRVAASLHIVANVLPLFKALKDSGADVFLMPCSGASTDDSVAAYLADYGICVQAWRGMNEVEMTEIRWRAVNFQADYLCDMGGELSLAYSQANLHTKAGLEATKSGVNCLTQIPPKFPVFDWNSTDLKNRLENRFHVGEQMWPVFNFLTQMALVGRKVLVIGYGPVGKGVAERARLLGAQVIVHDVDPIRRIEAKYHGCQILPFEQAVAQAQIIVTATGCRHVLDQDRLQTVRSGAILLNVGHHNDEIDLDYLYQQPYRKVRQHIERFDLESTYCYVLAGGNLLNLSGSNVTLAIDNFDPYTALMARGLTWLLEGNADSFAPGLYIFPRQLELELAEKTLQLTCG